MGENTLATPDNIAIIITAIFGGLAVLIAAVGTLIVGVIGAKREIISQGTRIEHATNGAVKEAASEATRAALEDTVAGLRQQLEESITARVEAALVARQAADDVRSAPKRDTE